MSYCWWKHGVIYQIYPRSFQDASGDGIGDLQGVISRLDYLNDGTPQSLGVDAIWFSPIFPSPMADFGYDVADYCDIHPDFGDLATFDRLVAECHRRGIRVILDFVPNHTSSDHQWFKESRSSRASPKRDWYVWRDPAPGGGPPNNWIAGFGGSAWEWDAATGQYYLHSFLREQPDVNWRNPGLIAAMHNVLRFWMDRGVDGFRIDVADRLVKDPLLRDNPPHPDPGVAERWGEAFRQVHLYDLNWPENHAALRGIRRVLDEYPERMAVGEVFGTPAQIAEYLGGAALDELPLAFNFAFVFVTAGAWQAARVRNVLDSMEAALPVGGWPTYALGNHDRPRIASRLGSGAAGQARARVAAMLLLTLRGTPFVYYGEEIGMEDVAIPEDRLVDPARHRAVGRDPERTPMQWTPDGGFSAGEPWLPYGDLRINVADQRQDPGSMLSLYRRLIWLRKTSDALRFGTYRPLESPQPVFAYVRETGAERLLVALNFGGEPAAIALPRHWKAEAVLASTHPEREGDRPGQEIDLAPDEGIVLRLG